MRGELAPAPLCWPSTRATPRRYHCHDGEPRLAHDYSITTSVEALDAAQTPDGGTRLTVRVRERNETADLSEVGGPRGRTTTHSTTVVVRVTATGEMVSALRTTGR